MQESTSAHKSNFSVAAIQEVFGEKLITHVLWPRFPMFESVQLFSFCGDPKRWSLCKKIYIFNAAFEENLPLFQEKSSVMHRIYCQKVRIFFYKNNLIDL
jgi:hypothetical protein